MKKKKSVTREIKSLGSWSQITLEGNGGVKSMGKMTVRKYVQCLTIVLNTGVFHFSISVPCVLHHHCLPSLYATNLLEENIFKITC